MRRKKAEFHQGMLITQGSDLILLHLETAIGRAEDWLVQIGEAMEKLLSSKDKAELIAGYASAIEQMLLNSL